MGYKPSYRFKHDCRYCDYRTDLAHSKACRECVQRDIYEPSAIEACDFCHYPLDKFGACDHCSEKKFDGRVSYLSSLTVCGIGNTDGHWSERVWKELGGAVAGAKGNQPEFTQPLAWMTVSRLYWTQQERPRSFNVVTQVPSTKPLLPAVFQGIESYKDHLGMGEALFDPAILEKTTEEAYGFMKISPWERWELLHRDQVYRVAKPKAIQNGTVLLIEDIYKSGCTMEMCAKLLLEAGASEVHGFAICRWPRRGAIPILREKRVP